MQSKSCRIGVIIVMLWFLSATAIIYAGFQALMIMPMSFWVALFAALLICLLIKILEWRSERQCSENRCQCGSCHKPEVDPNAETQPIPVQEDEDYSYLMETCEKCEDFHRIFKDSGPEASVGL